MEHGVAYEKAKEYYPEYWSKERLLALYGAGKLTRDDYIEIVGEDPDL